MGGRVRGPLLWEPLAIAVIVALETFVFAPRQMTLPMIWGGIVGAAVAVAWLVGGSA